VWQPASLRDPEAVRRLRQLAPEVIVAAAYGQILRQEVLEIPSRGVLNLHPSLLPRWRGASPVAAAILAGDERTGVTIILMDAGMDTGPILSQREVPINPTDTTGSLTNVLAEAGASLLAETLPRWLAGQIEPTPQDEAKATKCPLLKKEDGALDWRLAAVDLWRRVRAYNPWPGAFTYADGEMLHIWQAWPIESAREEAPGTVVTLTDHERAQLPPEAANAFGVVAGRGVLAVLQGQRAGRRALPAGELLRGMPWLLGRRLSQTPAGPGTG
jgi:methionyl-tRNA formyltransferase